MKLKAIVAISGILLIASAGMFLTQRRTIKTSRRSHRRIVLQPTPDVPQNLVEGLYSALKQTDTSVELMRPVTLPKTSYYCPRARYRADSIIHWFSRNHPAHETVIVVTTSDISATKGDKKDWGVIGLGLCPGNACVVSSFRLSKANTLDQLYKICLHELGHTSGLPHCSEAYCFMRDAEGHNVSDEMRQFCTKCSEKMHQLCPANTFSSQ